MYVPVLVPYCPLVTPVTAIELTVGTVGSYMKVVPVF